MSTDPTAPRARRVLHVFKDFFPPTFGGVEQHISEITRSLGPDFEFAVLTASRSPGRRVEELDGVRIVRSAEWGRVLSTPVTPSWWWELRRQRGDIVHVHLPNPVAELACPERPVVASYHADIVRNAAVARWSLPLQHRFLARVRRIVVGSPLLADTSPTLARHRDRVTVIPYGIDPDEWPVAPEAVEEIRRAHGAHRRPLVLFLGRLVAYKGVEVLIQAMRAVDASLLIVGDGPARPALEAAARAAGSGGTVRFIGNVSNENRSAYYQAADVFVLPAVSRAESFGIAMLEAMAQGTPAISTEVGTGTSWVNQTGETGLVVPPRDPERLASAITTLLADDALRKELGQAAAGRARQHFSKRTMVERLAALYRELA